MENISYPMTKNISDNILELPVDKKEPNQNEIQMVNVLFKDHKRDLISMLVEAKESIIVGILFVIFSLPQFDMVMNKILPFTQNSIYILILIKIVIIMVLFWVIKHFYLTRRGN